MAITVQERNLGRKEGGKTAERQYVITGATDSTTALAYMLGSGAVPTIVDALVRQDVDCTVEELALGVDGNFVYLGTAAYADPNWSQIQPVGNFALSFDISGTNVHLTQALATVHTYNRPGSGTRDFKGVIGLNSDGSIDGCDIQVPAITYQLTHTHPINFFSDDGTHFLNLTNCVGTVNSDTWYYFLPGTLLCTRISGQKRPDGYWDITYGFAVSKNITNRTIGDITGIDKKGWEYLWVHYIDDIQTVAGVTFHQKVPGWVTINEVYPKSTYATLGV